jgi:hypothetical protein
MLWIGLLLVAAAVGITVRWFLNRTDSLGRPNSFPAISVVLLLVLGGAAFVPVVLRAKLEHRLSEVAGALVGSPVRVHCQSFGESFVDAHAELGYVAFDANGVPERSTLIKRDQCRDLSVYLRSDKTSPTDEQIVAVHTLTHESMHMSGITNEAATECAAVQRDYDTASLLGATPPEARALTVTYWQRFYPNMSDDYRSSDCVPGGKMDEHLPHAPWAPAP